MSARTRPAIPAPSVSAADAQLRVATHIARRRVERRADPSLEATPSAILEAAEQLHWLTGGE